MNKYLVIGLGSMGKRRIRCLLALGISCKAILGTDIREDRCKEAEEEYGIQIVSGEEEIDFADIRAVIVSLPPDRHEEGAKIALRHQKPVFIEASVVLEDVLEIRKMNKNNVLVAPSCTMIYHPMIRQIKDIVDSQQYGRVCNFSYHSGQYLPDWHPWENVEDYYVSNRVTGGAREIVPFELTWMVYVFGYPRAVKGYCRKTRNVGCDIEDSYACVIDYGNMLGSLMVDVVGRNAARNLVINFEEAQLQWRWDKKKIEIYEADSRRWKVIHQEECVYKQGYNENIVEKMYIDELSAFLEKIDSNEEFTNTLEKDIDVLKLLMLLEESDDGRIQGNGE